MAQVVDWPRSPQEPGFINLHYSLINKRNPSGKKIVTGWPTRDVGSFIQKAAWAITTNDIKDLWFCTSLQSQSGKNSKGNPKAIRGAQFALTQKSIWIDMDVGENDPKKYTTVQEALTAALRFQATVGLPKPSAIVFSGNGVHVYWISKDPLTPAEWAPYAGGLKALLLANSVKCDSGLTTDIARILRVPGTFNHKTEPPKPVQLSPTPLALYNFETQLSFLKNFAVTLSTPGVVKPATIFADDANLESFKRPPAFKIDEPDLNAGIDKHQETLLQAEPIFKGCGFLKQSLLNGGKDYDNTLWMYSVLCSTFMENGNAIAHAISKDHASYTQADTQALYDRKVAERHDRGIGYPSCATIQGAGCTACATCPLLAKGKSPLNIRGAAAHVTATVTGGTLPPVDLPPTFALNNEGIICKVIETEEGENAVTTMVPLFQAVLTDFWLQKHPGEHLNFTMTVDKGFTEQTSIDLGEVSTQGFRSYLGKRRVLINPNAAPKLLEEFVLSMIGKLRALTAAQQSVPFGWYEENGVRRGFVFGGKIMKDDGSERPCGAADPNIARKYRPIGDLAKWHAAAATVTNRKRPELTAIMLMSFASPLLELYGKESLMFSAYGSDSGAGKSSAYKVGMSVWGHPLLTKGTETQTANNITTIMKTIRNLPFYWDEITDDVQREKVAKVMHEADGGKEKGRNLDGVRTQTEGTWALMIHYASNGSYLSFLRQRNQNTTASVARVLEWEVKRIDGGPGHLNDADAALIINETYRNYGQMGLQYAKFLAMNHKQITEELRLKCNEVQAALGGGNSERYWYTAVAIMACAAKYAKGMGIDLDPQEIEDFMFKVYRENLMIREEFSIGGTVDNSETVLTRYLKERAIQERGIWTNYMHNKQGKPTKPVLLLKGPTQPRNTQGIEFRFAVENQILVISQTDFNAWLKFHKHAEAQVYSALKQVYGSEKQKLQLCSGTIHDTGREECLVLKVEPNTPLWGYMTTFVPPEEKARMEAAQEPEPTTTGLTPADNVIAFVQGAVRG